jgi:hypothetical protein
VEAVERSTDSSGGTYTALLRDPATIQSDRRHLVTAGIPGRQTPADGMHDETQQ